MEVRRTFWVFLGGLLISLVGMYLTQSRLYMRFFYMCVLIIVSSFLWTLVSVRGYQFKRYARTLRQNMGQIFIEQFELQNNSRHTRVWAGVLDQCEMEGKMGSRVLTWIGAKQKRSYVSYTLLQRRGLYQLGPTQIFSGDPLGLFKIKKSFQSTQSLVVLPYLVDLNKFPSPPGLLTGGRVIGRRTLETTPQVSSIREYIPGDPLNRIHWLSTLRRDKLMVKEFENDPRADIWIFLDAQKRIHSKKDDELPISVEEQPFWRLKSSDTINLPANSFEYAVSIAGSIANYYIRMGKAVGFVSVGQTMTVLTPERGDRQQHRILETLAFILPEGKMDLSVLVSAQAPNLARDSTVILITTSDNEDLQYAVDPIIRRRLKPLIILLNAYTFQGLREPEYLLGKLSKQNIPVLAIQNQDNLKERLEEGFGYSGQPVRYWTGPILDSEDA